MTAEQSVRHLSAPMHSAMQYSVNPQSLNALLAVFGMSRQHRKRMQSTASQEDVKYSALLILLV